MNRDGSLEHDRTAIQLGGDEMNGRTRDLDAMFDRLPLCVQARERRQKRRVDVQDAILKRVEERRANEPHVARETDQIDVLLSEHSRKRSIELVASQELLWIETARRNPSGCRPLE